MSFIFAFLKMLAFTISKNKNEGYQFFFNKRTIAKKNEIITYIINLIFLRIVKRGKRLFTNINSFESLSL